MNNTSIRKKRKIDSLGGLKVIAVFLLLWWHASLGYSATPKAAVDLGARTCEFFFVASGFLMAYNHKDEKHFENIGTYMKKKIAGMYPLHVITLVLTAIILLQDEIKVQTKRYVIRAICSLFLVQTWTDEQATFFAYNGVSWFLSAILFCYLLTPIFLRALRSKKRAFFFLIFAMGLRFFIEWVTIHYPGEFLPISIHVNPFVRSLEYFGGMVVYSFWESVEEYKEVHAPKKRGSFLLFSLLEISAITLTILLCLKYNNLWMRFEYVLMFYGVLFVFAFDGGCVSWLLKGKFFKFFSSIELEFFMFHVLVLSTLVKYLVPYYPNWILLIGLGFVITTIIAYAYRHFLKGHLSRALMFLLKKL